MPFHFLISIYCLLYISFFFFSFFPSVSSLIFFVLICSVYLSQVKNEKTNKNKSLFCAEQQMALGRIIEPMSPNAIEIFGVWEEKNKKRGKPKNKKTDRNYSVNGQIVEKGTPKKVSVWWGPFSCAYDVPQVVLKHIFCTQFIRVLFFF